MSLKKKAKSAGVKMHRRLLRWLYKGVIAAACFWLAFFLTVLTMRKVAVGAIIELTGAKVSVQSVNVALNGWVNIRGLLIGPHQHPGYENTILKAQTVRVHFEVASLLLLHPKVNKMVIRDFVLDAQYDLDTGRWNTSAIHARAPETKSSNVPVIVLEKGTIRHSKISKGRISVVASIPVDARLEPAAKAEDGYKFSITTAERAYIGRSTLTGSWRRGSIIMSGGISSADVAAFERVWTVHVLAAELKYRPDGDYSLDLRMHEVLSTQRSIDRPFVLDSRKLIGKLGAAAALQGFFDRFRPTGRVDLELNASGNWGRPGENTLKCSVLCRGVTIKDRRFAYAIEGITGRVNLDFERQTIELKDLRGRHGDVQLNLSGWYRGAGKKRQYEYTVASDNMALDKDLYEAFSAGHKALWSAFSPTGSAAIKYRVSKLSDSATKTMLDVELQGVEAVYQSFPYPLQKLTGKLHFDRSGVTISNVVSQFDGRKITINGMVGVRTAGEQSHNVEIKAQNIPLDSTLAAALPEKQRAFYEQLSMTGAVDARINVFSVRGNKKHSGFVASVHCRDSSLAIPGLVKKKQGGSKDAFLISGISADVVISDDMIGIENFKGSCGPADVSLNGRIELDDKQMSPACHISAQVDGLEIDDDLLNLLPRAGKRFTAKLRPEGKINLGIKLDKDFTPREPDIEMTVDCSGNSLRLNETAISENAVSLGFERILHPLRDITGRLTITKNAVRFNNIKAVVVTGDPEPGGKPTLEIDGQISMPENGVTDAWFRLAARDIFANKQFESLLPKAVGPLYSTLSQSGRFDLDLKKVRIIGSGKRAGQIDFDGVVGFKDSGLDIHPVVTELNGELKINGSYTMGQGLANAEAVLSADSLKLKGKVIRQVRSNIYYDSKRHRWLTKELIGRCYGGKFMGEFELGYSGQKVSDYLMQTGFFDIDLKEFLGTTIPKQNPKAEHTGGKMSGSFSIAGSVDPVANIDTSRAGACRLSISDMKVGKLSLLAKLLNALKLTFPGDYAFDRMAVDSYIKGDRVIIRHVGLSGATTAFSGSGWIDLPSEKINLVLFTGKRDGETKPSVLKSFTMALGYAMVRIEVSGFYYDPKITTQALPVFGNTLKILGTKSPKAGG